MDFDSRHVLAEHDADARMEPASLTKIMSVYVIADELKQGHVALADQVTISEKAWRMTGSRMFVEVGKQVSVDDLLKGIIVQSGNDASVALAEHIAGSDEAFAELMNAQAQKLRMSGSHFTNSSGLPHPDHYITARDVALLSAALIKDHPEVYALFAHKDFVYNDITQPNRNQLLWRDPSVDGIKTGHTETAGFCLAASAKRENMRLISVVLGAASDAVRTDASTTLLNYGFRFFQTHRLYGALQAITSAKVWKGASPELKLGLAEDLYLTIPKDQYEQLDASMELEQRLMAPIASGEQHGVLRISLNGNLLSERPLVALHEVAVGSLMERLTDEVKLWIDR